MKIKPPCVGPNWCRGAVCDHEKAQQRALTTLQQLGALLDHFMSQAQHLAHVGADTAYNCARAASTVVAYLASMRMCQQTADSRHAI